MIWSQIGFLNNLQKLFLGDNQMENLPHRLTQCTKLQMLNLEGNALRKLPTDLESWSNLTMLQLNNNAIRELPHQVITPSTASSTAADSVFVAAWGDGCLARA